jgi:Cu2+-exporting ATPase
MLAATAEYKQTHPVALSILKAAREQDIELSSTDATEYEIGYGIRVKINNARILVGSLRFMTLEQVLIPSCFQSRVEICHRDGISLVYIAENGRLVGALEFDACLRPEAKGVINWLKTSGIRLYIVSGDAEAPTRRLADELGMDAYFANILPDGKADIIKQLKSDGQKPGFIGDGINDAIALREADVSISFCSATQAASDNAAIILMNNDLRQLQTLFKLAWSFEKSVSVNYRTSLVMTLVAGAGAIVLPWKFLIVQSMFVVNYMIGFVVATRPLLDKSINTDKKPD